MRCSLFLVLLMACSSAGSEPIESPDANPDGAELMPPVAPCTGFTAQPRDATWMIDGRKVLVHVPASYDPATPVPIVVDMHGLDSSGAEQASRSHMIAASDSNGFVAIHPDGKGASWNAGDCCDPSSKDGVADTAFIGKVLDEASARLCVDDKRVFAAGFSNGGFMAHRLGCELAGRFAAIGSVSGVLGIDTCHPARPVPVIQIHGTSDPIVPYGGGGLFDYTSVASTISTWRTIDNCSADAQTISQHGDATCVSYCGNVTLCTIDGGGHQWPGGTSSGVLNGKVSNDLDATAALWTFFAAHPR